MVLLAPLVQLQMRNENAKSTRSLKLKTLIEGDFANDLK